MTILAALALTLAGGTWLGLRYAEASDRIDTDIQRFILSLPVKDWTDDVDGRRW